MAIDVYDNLHFHSVAALISGAKLNIKPSADVVELLIEGYATPQSNDIIQVKTSAGGNIWKVTGGGLIDVYGDQRHNANVINTNHTTRIISGLYITPLINNGILSGGLNANSTRISSLSNGAAMNDAVNVNQMNTSLSGHTNSSNVHNGVFVRLSAVGTDNKITAQADDATTLTVEGYPSTPSLYLIDCYNEPGGITVFSARANGAVFASDSFTAVGSSSTFNGITNSNAQISQVAAGTALTDVVNVNQLNVGISGLLTSANFKTPTLSGQIGDFFTTLPMGVLSLANPITYQVLASDTFYNGGIDHLPSDVYPLSCNRKSKAKEVAVTSFTLVATSGWKVILHKNGSACGVFDIGNAVYPSSASTSGFWRPLSGQNLDFNVGDKISMIASGFAANGLFVMVNPGWEAR